MTQLMNRYSKIILTLTFILSGQQFFGMAAAPSARSSLAESVKLQLIAATEAGDLALVRTIIEKADETELLLIQACEANDFARVKTIIEQNPTIKINAHRQDENPLHHQSEQALWFAASANNLDMVKFLLDHGANDSLPDTSLVRDIDRYDGGISWYRPRIYHRTVLPVAIRHDNQEMVRLLLEHGADANGFEYRYGKVLSLAALENHFEIASLLLKHGAKINALSNCCELCSSYEIEDSSALALAFYRNMPEAAKFLLDNGANPFTKASRGATTLHLAVNWPYNNTKMLATVKCALDHGADLFAKTSDGYTALQLALRNPRAPIISSFLAEEMAKTSILHALLVCGERTDPKSVPHGEFPPEDINRILRPAIIATLLTKNP